MVLIIPINILRIFSRQLYWVISVVDLSGECFFFLFLHTKQLSFSHYVINFFPNASNVPLFDIIYSFKDEQTSQVFLKIISDLSNLSWFLLKHSKMVFQKQSKTVNSKLLILFKSSLAVALVRIFSSKFSANSKRADLI